MDRELDRDVIKAPAQAEPDCYCDRSCVERSRRWRGRRRGCHFLYNYRRLSIAAMGADTGNLDQRAFRRETGRARGSLERFGGGAARRLADRSAAFADQENHEIATLMVVHAGDKGVAALDPMNEAVIAQKFQRAIDGDGRRARFLLQSIDDFIGAERPMTRQQSFKDLPPHRGEPLTARNALRLSMRDCRAGAALMIMVGCREDCGRHDCLDCCPRALAQLLQPVL